MISIIVPTIDGREEHLNACKAAYAATTEDYELIVVPNRPGCGVAWVEGAAKAGGQYVHFSADDLRPIQGWWQAALEVLHRGFLPAPRILNDDGTLQTCGGSDGHDWQGKGIENPTGQATDFSRIPFLTREQWDTIAPLVADFLSHVHYYTDNAISAAAFAQGIWTGIHRGYAFHHSHLSMNNIERTTERMRNDHALFREWLKGVKRDSGLEPDPVLQRA